MEKRVTVYLEGGRVVEHQLIVDNKSGYLKQIQATLKTFQGFPEGLLFFTSPTYATYPIAHIVGLEFHDPPAPKTATMGFRLGGQ